MKQTLALIAICVFTSQLYAQVSYTLSSSPGVGSNPNWATAADINGDGRPDLISANNDGTLSVLTNNGAGGFVTTSTYNAGDAPHWVITVDINGDGKLDLISANYMANTLSVLTNNGSGGFATFSSLSVGVGPISVTAADVNEDGKLDLISANRNADTLSVLTNNGAGGFVLASSPGVGSAPTGVVAADINGDGKPELISVNQGGNTLSVLTNNGSGGFVLASSPGAGSTPFSVIAADVNGDGRLDLISVNNSPNTLSVLTNNGSGGFVLASSPGVGSHPQAVISTDVNGDGKVDLISANTSANTLSILTNNGSGGFVLALSPGVGSNPVSAVAEDVNGDGRVDLISVNTSANTLSVLANTSSFPPSSLPIITAQPATSQTNLLGTTAFFNVAVTATGTEAARHFSYQWRLAGTNLPAATNNPFLLPTVAVSQSGIYDVVISNFVGSVTSSPATLVVPAPVTIATQPASQVVAFGSPVSFSVIASGYPGYPISPMTYQWSHNGTNLPGATSNVFTINHVKISDLGSYQVLVGNGYGSTNSDVATLNMSPSIITPFAGATAIWGMGAALSVGAIGSGSLTYQWYQDGVAVNGATNATLNFTSIQITNGGLYSVIVSSSFGTVTNMAAQVIVNPAGFSLGFCPALTISGVVGYSYLIQSSTNLVNTNAWVTLTNLTLTQPVQLWVDTSVDASSPFNSKYFYRILPVQ